MQSLLQYFLCTIHSGGFPSGSVIICLPMQETSILSLGQEDPLEKEMATHSSILAWKIPCTEEPGGLQFMGSQRVGHGWLTNTFTFFRLTVDRLGRQPSSQQGWCYEGDIKARCEHPRLWVCLCDVKQCIRISFWPLLVTANHTTHKSDDVRRVKYIDCLYIYGYKETRKSEYPELFK